MRVLLVNQYYPPDRSATATMARAAARALVEAGHETTVLAGRPSYDTAERRAWRLARSEIDEGVHVLRVGSTAAERRNMVGRVSNYLSFAAIASGAMATQTYDVAIAMTDPPFVASVVQIASRAKRKPSVIWTQDHHPWFAHEAGLIGDGQLFRRWAQLQRATLARADAVIAIGDDMAEQLVANGARVPRVHVVPNGAAQVPHRADPDDYAKVIKEVRRDFGFVALHGGNIGYGGAFGSLIKAWTTVPDECALTFVGDGAMRRQLEAAAAGSKNVSFIDRIAPDEFAAAATACELQVVTVRRGVEGLMVPTKLYDALVTGRPVLAVADEKSDVVRVVRRHRCGLIADPDNPREITAAVRWATEHRDELAAMGQRASEVVPLYARDTMMKRIVEIVESLGRQSR
jgi:glycosyltransferase involved in cell wall biosynthesis